MKTCPTCGQKIVPDGKTPHAGASDLLCEFCKEHGIDRLAAFIYQRRAVCFECREEIRDRN